MASIVLTEEQIKEKNNGILSFDDVQNKNMPDGAELLIALNSWGFD